MTYYVLLYFCLLSTLKQSDRAPKQSGKPCELGQLNYECNVVEETLELVLCSNGPTSQQYCCEVLLGSSSAASQVGQ